VTDPTATPTPLCDVMRLVVGKAVLCAYRAGHEGPHSFVRAPMPKLLRVQPTPNVQKSPQ
jgi:hypothetical protein